MEQSGRRAEWPSAEVRGARAETGGRLHIRTASPEDVETLFEIRTSVRENHQSRPELARIGVTPHSVTEMLRTTSCAWIAEIDELPAAFVMADRYKGTVFAMFVRPGYEGRGLGRRLMERAEDWMFAGGADEIWLTTGRDPALRAHGFYRHLGWMDAGPTDDGQILYVKRRS